MVKPLFNTIFVVRKDPDNGKYFYVGEFQWFHDARRLWNELMDKGIEAYYFIITPEEYESAKRRLLEKSN